MPDTLRPLFMLRPDVTFLNHGSFGACPRPVFENYVDLLRQIESEPVDFVIRQSAGLYRQAREAIGAYLNADADDLVFVSNATVGVNIVARSVQMNAGDEVLTTDHEYGACDRTWRMLCEKSGATYRSVPIPVPVTTHEEFVERFWSQVRPETRIIFISHITSPTALTFPVAAICRLARQRGIITIVDGAHTAGQIPVDLQEIGADFYTGNFHKWLCSPKGSAFLYARRDKQAWLEPLVISWGGLLGTTGSEFVDNHQFRGTRDFASALAVPAAIDFQREHNWDAVRQECHAIVRRARPLICQTLDAEPISPDSPEWFAQMGSFLLPRHIDGDMLGRMLFEHHRVEIPTPIWNDRQLIRISVQGYNTWEDVERLLEAIAAVRPMCLR